MYFTCSLVLKQFISLYKERVLFCKRTQKAPPRTCTRTRRTALKSEANFDLQEEVLVSQRGNQLCLIKLEAAESREAATGILEHPVGSTVWYASQRILLAGVVSWSRVLCCLGPSATGSRGTLLNKTDDHKQRPTNSGKMGDFDTDGVLIDAWSDGDQELL